MTYDELVEKVARAMDPGMWEEHDQRGNMPTSITISKGHAKTAIDTIREALIQSFSKEMERTARDYTGAYYNQGMWQAMLAASPLGEKAK